MPRTVKTTKKISKTDLGNMVKMYDFYMAFKIRKQKIL